MTLNPLTWSKATERTYITVVVLFVGCLLGLLVWLGDQWMIEHRLYTVLAMMAMASALFSVLWLAFTKKYGPWLGLLIAIIYFIVWTFSIPIMLRFWR